MPDDWHPEALRAQAVVARSYALATLKPGTLFDLYADTRSQVYGGVQAEEATTNRAIGSTAGKVLVLERPRRDDLLPLDLGRPDGLDRGGLAARDAGAVPRLGRRPLRHALEAPPLGAVPADAGAGGGEGSASRASATSSSHADRRAGSRRCGSKAVRSTRTMLSQDFRRALDLRSTWFSVRVLNLDTPLERALANRPVKLRGFVRGLTKVRLEQQVNGGTWTTVRPVKTRPDGRFTVTVHAAADDQLPARDPQGRGRSGHCRAALAPVRVRRSRKARSPSWPSSLVRRSAILRAVSGPSGRSRTSRFACRAARGPALRSSASTRSTAASRSASTSWTSPIRSAVAASNRSPVTK